MLTTRVPTVLAVLSVTAILAWPDIAAAQVMSKWGHPVITFGWTPYDSVNTGHGNYPGSPGFIPGYGYYPGSGSDHYPWMDGPGTPFDRRKLQPIPVGGEPREPVAEPSPLPGTALIIVKVPAEAEISFDGQRTSQAGSYRVFVTPSLPADRLYVYTIRARWLTRNIELLREENVHLQAGHTVTVNFLTSDSWTGRQLETLPDPKRASSRVPQSNGAAISEQ
jgi:uncharacterized protein (TIGR03000 family)